MKKLVVDERLTQQVANLARLELTPGEVTKFTRQLGDIVGYIDQLQALDVKGVLPLTHPLVDHSSEMREDEVVEFPKDNQGHPKTLGPAPESVVEDGGGSFKVPQVI
jgi:aspartyl-tRNA(Asn)/glutamyl-tRNA(Gln) amidotransferase subunit C